MTKEQTDNVFDALEIAKYFLDKAKQNQKTISNKKLQKLLYYAQAWHLVNYDKPLFKEKIEAWIHGPAIREIYLKFKNYGMGAIKIDENINFNLPKEQTDLLDAVWKIYGKYDADYLEELTHNEAPWQQARQGLDIITPSSNEITHQSMKDYYQKLVNES